MIIVIELKTPAHHNFIYLGVMNNPKAQVFDLYKYNYLLSDVLTVLNSKLVYHDR